VADRGADCDTTGRKLAGSSAKSSPPDFLGKVWILSTGVRWTYAAVEAIWPKSPGPALCWGGACMGCCWGWAAVE
jgi:hypothetical protein